MSDVRFIPDEPVPIARRRISVTRLMLGVLVVGGSIGMIGRLVLQAREGARANQCEINLKMIGLSLHNYHSAYGCFPPPYIADANGKPIHSWRMVIYPFMESSPINKSYTFAEPWDGPNNRKVLDQYHPFCYECPTRGAKPGLTSYVMIVGPKTLAPGVRSITLSDIRDGADQTIMVAEVSNLDIPWTEPRDLDTRTMSWVINDPLKPSLSSPHGRGPAVLYADGTVRRLNPSLPAATLEALTTIDGHEPEVAH